MVAGFADLNDACSLKQVDRDTAAALHDFNVIELAREPEASAFDCSAAPDLAFQPWPGHWFLPHWGRPDPWRSLTLPQRQRLLCLAASSGHAPSLDAALEHAGCDMPPRGLTAAAAAGDLAACERLLALGHRRIVQPSAARAAAQEGHIAVLQLLLGASASVGAEQECLKAATRGACAGGRLSVLHWLQANHPTTVSALACANEAAAAGHAELLESLLPLLHASWADAAGRQAGRGKSKLSLLESITRGCPVEVLRRHFDSLWPWGPAPVPAVAGAGAVAAGGADLAAAAAAGAGGAGDAAAAAAGEPPRDMELATLFTAAAGSATPCWAAKLDFLCGAFPPGTAARLLRCGGFCFDEAARAPEFVARLRRLWHLAGWQPRAAGKTAAAAAGAAVIRDPGQSVARSMVLSAAQYGHADALRYLLDECGVPLEFYGTSVRRYMKFPENLRSRRGPCGAATTGAAGADRHLEVLQLLVAKGFNFTAEHLALQGCWHWASAAVRLRWLVEVAKGVAEEGEGGASVAERWSAAFVAAAQGGAGLPVLRSLRARGAAVDLGAVACGGSLEALEWAAAELEAERGDTALQQELISYDHFVAIHRAGDTRTRAWLWGRGLVKPMPPPMPPLQEEAHLAADDDGDDEVDGDGGDVFIGDGGDVVDGDGGDVFDGDGGDVFDGDGGDVFDGDGGDVFDGDGGDVFDGDGGDVFDGDGGDVFDGDDGDAFIGDDGDVFDGDGGDVFDGDGGDVFDGDGGDVVDGDGGDVFDGDGGDEFDGDGGDVFDGDGGDAGHAVDDVALGGDGDGF